MGSKMGAADPNYPKIQGLSRLSRLSYGIAARQSYSISAKGFECGSLVAIASGIT